LPDACYDFYDLARGAGGVLLVRVTDGNEAQADGTLYTRRVPRSPMGTIKAKNGGRWGGKKKEYTDDVSASGKILNTTLDTEDATMTKDEWKGGWIRLDAVANTLYPIVGNDAAGVITVASNSTMKDDWTAAAAPANLRYYVYLENEDKALSYEIRDGEEKPDTEFGLFVYVDGVLANNWPNLSVEPTDARYWADVINDDTNNDEVVVTDSLTGALTADDRPANYYGQISAVTATVLTSDLNDFDPDATGDGDGTAALGTTTDAMVDDTITITFSAPTTFTAVSAKFGSLGAAGTVGVLFTPNNDWSPPFTLTAGGTAWELNDVATLVYRPFITDALIGGYIYPDKVNAKKVRFRIVDNDHKTITAAPGSDMTADGAISDYFMVVAPMELENGKDGIADLTDADYENQAWNLGGSPFDRILGRNLGLVKMGTPGNTATAVQKAGIAYADAKNHQYRLEFPSGTVTEEAADTYVNDTIGRNDFAVSTLPSYGSVTDPEGQGQGKLKLVPLTGMIHGMEARTANAWKGYHKAAAGLDAKLPAILELPTGEAILNEEYLNPIGIGIVKKVKGNFIVWGDRTLNTSPEWKWKHQREMICYYENVLRESFDWIVFAINDPIEQIRLLSSLKAFFLPEWVKRALRGDSFEEAAVIRSDSELNTDATRAAGDMIAEIKLRLADTVERLTLRIGKQGVFESFG